MSSASKPSLLTVSMKYSKPCRSLRCAMLSIDPVDRLSRIRTSWPCASRASERWEPMKPAPPVTRARTDAVLSSRIEGVHRLGDRIDVIVVHRGTERQREYLMAHLRRDGTGGWLPRRKPRLLRERYRLVNQGLDAGRGEVRL